MKKGLSVFIILIIMVFCSTFVVFAAEDNSAKLIVSYDMNQSYSVVIPADFAIIVPSPETDTIFSSDDIHIMSSLE